MFDYQATKKQYLDCPICESRKNKSVFVGDRYQMGITTVICEKCGLIYTNPRPEDRVFDEFYEKHYRMFYESVEHPSEKYIQEGRFTKRASIVYTHLRNFIEDKNLFCDPIKILDVGCSEGSVLRFIQENAPRKISALGIEPSKEFSKFAREYSGTKIYSGNLESFFSENKWSRFDIIIVNHVLEHFLYPVKALSCLRGLLKDDGIIFFEVPNILGKWSGISMFHIAHVFQFDEMSLKNLLALKGFSPVSISTEGNEIHPWAMSFICKKDPEAKVVFPTRKQIKNKIQAVRGKINHGSRQDSGMRWLRQLLNQRMSSN